MGKRYFQCPPVSEAPRLRWEKSHVKVELKSKKSRTRSRESKRSTPRRRRNGPIFELSSVDVEGFSQTGLAAQEAL